MTKEPTSLDPKAYNDLGVLRILMESAPMAERIWVQHWRVIQNSGTFYLSVPKEYASLQGIRPGDQLEVTVWAVHKQGEKKK